MKDYTDVSGASGKDAGGAVPVVVSLLRRAGATAGFVFGLGLLALLTANNASADESRPDGSDTRPSADRSLLGSVGESLSPVTEQVERALKPVTPALAEVADVADPVVRPVADLATGVTEAAKPVLEPVTKVVAEVAAPVLDTAEPVLDAVAPVTAPLTGPLLDAVDPVVEPVAEAVGLRDEVAEVTDTVSGARRDVLRSPPADRPEPAQVTALAAPDAVVEADDRGTHGDVAHVVSVVPVLWESADGTGDPGQVPTVPTGPSGAVPGGSGSLGGFGGSHSADAAVTSPAGPFADDSGSSRGPPGTIAGLSWFGYDRIVCPS